MSNLPNDAQRYEVQADGTCLTMQVSIPTDPQVCGVLKLPLAAPKGQRLVPEVLLYKPNGLYTRPQSYMAGQLADRINALWEYDAHAQPIKRLAAAVHDDVAQARSRNPETKLLFGMLPAEGEEAARIMLGPAFIAAHDDLTISVLNGLHEDTKLIQVLGELERMRKALADAAFALTEMQSCYAALTQPFTRAEFRTVVKRWLDRAN